MNDPDEEERALRLELMHLERKLKVLDLKRMDQLLAYGPIKLALAAGLAGVMIALLIGILVGGSHL